MNQEIKNAYAYHVRSTQILQEKKRINIEILITMFTYRRVYENAAQILNVARWHPAFSDQAFLRNIHIKAVENMIDGFKF